VTFVDILAVRAKFCTKFYTIVLSTVKR